MEDLLKYLRQAKLYKAFRHCTRTTLRDYGDALVANSAMRSFMIHAKIAIKLHFIDGFYTL